MENIPGIQEPRNKLSRLQEGNFEILPQCCRRLHLLALGYGYLARRTSLEQNNFSQGPFGLSHAILPHYNLAYRKEQLGHLEQQRAYVQAFQPQLLKAVMDWLQLKHQDHHPSTPYKIEDVFDTARFVLPGTTTNYSPPDTSAPTNNTMEPSIKKEELSALFSEFGKTIIEALNMNANRPCNGNTGNWTFGTLKCIMCGGLHFGQDCSTVEEFIKAGKCRRNHK